MPNLSPNRCILENSIGPRAELSILISINGFQTVLQDQQALVHLCLSLFRRRNWKRHIFGPDLRGGNDGSGPNDLYRPEVRGWKSL